MSLQIRGHCVVTDHARRPTFALVSAVNPDGSYDALHIHPDPKVQRRLLSADFDLAIVFSRHMKHYLTKVAEAMAAENELAKKEARDADYERIHGDEALIADCICEPWRVNPRSQLTTTGEEMVVAYITITGEEVHSLPQRYIAPPPEQAGDPAVPAPVPSGALTSEEVGMVRRSLRAVSDEKVNEGLVSGIERDKYPVAQFPGPSASPVAGGIPAPVQGNAAMAGNATAPATPPTVADQPASEEGTRATATSQNRQD